MRQGNLGPGDLSPTALSAGANCAAIRYNQGAGDSRPRDYAVNLGLEVAKKTTRAWRCPCGFRGQGRLAIAAHRLACAEAPPKGASTQPVDPGRDSLRSRRKRPVRAQTIAVTRIAKRDVQLARAVDPEANQRHLPLLRSECRDGARPCPFISCAHHLFLDVSRAGGIKVNFPDLVGEDGAIDFAAMPASCALDVGDEGRHTIERVGDLMNITRERVRQLEVTIMAKLVQNPILLEMWASR